MVCKHIDTSYHYVRNKVEEGAIRLEYIPIDQMVADGLTKPLESGKFLRSGLASATTAEHGAGEKEHGYTISRRSEYLASHGASIPKETGYVCTYVYG